MNAVEDELERAVIGAVLNANDTLNLLPALEITDFASWRGQVAWAAVRQLQQASSPLDPMLLNAQISRAGKLEAVGEAYAAECWLTATTPSNAIEYARILRDRGIKRRVRLALGDVLEKTKGDGYSGEETLSMALAEISGIDVDQPDATSTIGDIVRRRMRDLERIAEERLSGARTMTGYQTGVEALDIHIGGWQAGIVSLVAARPAMGKSSFGLATADACSAAGFGVHLFSLEDTEASYADRTLSRVSEVPAENMRNSKLTRPDMSSITGAVSRLIKRTHWIVDGRSGLTADEIVRSVRRKARDNRTKVVIVDYVQLVKRPTGQRMSSHEALTEIITTLADAAKQDGMAYVVMSQLNREVETRNDKRPVLSDLRESGSLEERAKCVIALYRGAYYTDFPDKNAKPSDVPWNRRVELIVLKNSNGKTGYVDAYWDGPTTRIS